jgi:hypothetical protein
MRKMLGDTIGLQKKFRPEKEYSPGTTVLIQVIHCP